MNKFRVRLYVKQFLEENKDSDFVHLDISGFNDNQVKVVYKKMYKMLLNSRKNKKSISIKAH